MRLLVTHRCTVLYAPQYITNVHERQRAEMAHGQSRRVTEICVAVDLTFLIVHQGLHHHTMDPDQVCR